MTACWTPNRSTKSDGSCRADIPDPRYPPGILPQLVLNRIIVTGRIIRLGRLSSGPASSRLPGFASAGSTTSRCYRGSPGREFGWRWSARFAARVGDAHRRTVRPIFLHRTRVRRPSTSRSIFESTIARHLPRGRTLMTTLKALTLIALISLVSPVWMPVAGAAERPAPSYLILRAPARPPQAAAYYPGRPYEVHTHTYAYGWFGAQPRQHLRRSTGYNESYIQWSRQ